MSARFLQIHTLTNYPASLLNRDDAGFAKRMPFGGKTRTRISSQCLKMHWREYSGEYALSSLGVPNSIRSREIFTRLVVPPVVTAGIPEQRGRRAVAALVALLQVGKANNQKAKAKRKSVANKFLGLAAEDLPQGAGRRRTRPNRESEETAEDSALEALKQVIVLGPSEVRYLVEEAIRLAQASVEDDQLVEFARERASSDQEKNLQALAASASKGAGISAALFGRMRTGDLFAETDAAIHVAHAMTVHEQMTESDYFTAIDDLVREEGEQGSGHINAAELTSGLFYGYVVVDVGGLVSNLGDNRDLAGDVVQRLVHIVSTVSPGAKKGSTAPYAYSHLVLVESGKAQPRTLQNAFIEPVKTAGNVVHEAYSALRQHLQELDEMYGKNEHRAHAGLATDGLFENKKTLSELAEWARARVLE